MTRRNRHSFLLFGLLIIQVLLCLGCSTYYVGSIDVDIPSARIQAQGEPLPIQLVVRSDVKDYTEAEKHLETTFVRNLNKTRKFAKVVSNNAQTDSSLKRLEADVDMELLLRCKTPTLYAAFWCCIFPLFLPGNQIIADGKITVSIQDDQSVIKTYSAHKKTTSGRRNSVGLVGVRYEMERTQKWAQPITGYLIEM
jgi:hypothetical protein